MEKIKQDQDQRPEMRISFNLKEHLELNKMNERSDSQNSVDLRLDSQEKNSFRKGNENALFKPSLQNIDTNQAPIQISKSIANIIECEPNTDSSKSQRSIQKNDEIPSFRNNNLPKTYEKVAFWNHQGQASTPSGLPLNLSGSYVQNGTLIQSYTSFKCDQNLSQNNNLLHPDDTQRRSHNLIEENTRFTRKIEQKKKIQGQFKFLTSILPKMKKFYEKRTFYGRTKTLNLKIRKFIEDPSDYIPHHNKENYFMGVLIFLYKMLLSFCKLLRLHKLPLIDPENSAKLIINAIIATYNMFYLFIMSIEVFFEAELGETATYLNSIATFAWISEMAIQMNTACYHDNHFVTDRAVIMKIYLKEYLFFEILPLLFEGKKSSHPAINILLHLPLLLKIKGMSIIIEKLEFYILQILDKAYFLQLMKLCMKVILLAHLIACSWFIVAELEKFLYHEEDTWVSLINLEKNGDKEIHLKWLDYYIEALYWSFSQMMNNSAQKPQTDIELAYTSFTMLLSSIILVYLINSIGEILADINKQQEDYKKDLNILNNFMKRKKIDLSLRRRANLNLLKHYQQQSRDKKEKEKEIIEKLSGYMQRELLLKSNEKFAMMFPLFSSMFSKETLTNLLSVMEEEVFAPNQIIFNQTKSQFNDTIYLIAKGQGNQYANSQKINNFLLQKAIMYIERVENSKQCKNQDESQQNLFSGGDESKQISASKRKVLKIIKEGECFGTHSFVTGREKVMNVMSTKFTELIKIRREKFISIVKENKQDFEKFMDLRDKVIFDKNYRKADGIKCHACHSQDHVYTDCNKVQFDKNNLFVIFRYNKSIDQKRVVTSRKNYLKINARSQFQIINKKASSYQAINDLIGSSEEFSENSQNESQEVDDNEDEDEQEESQQTNQEENNLQQNQTFQQHYDFTEHDSISDMAKNTSHIPKIKTAISLEKRGEQISAKKSLSIRGSHDFSGIEPSITSHYQSNITSVDKLENENVLNQTEQNCHSPLSPMKVKLVIQFSKQYKSDQNLFNSIINLRKNSSKYLQRIVKLLILSFYYIPKVLFSILKSFLTKNSLYAHSPKIQKVQKQPDLEEFMLSSNTQKIPSSFGIGGKAQQVLVPTQVSFGRPQTTKHSKFDSSAVIQYEGISRHNTTRNRRYSGVSATVQTFLEGEFFFWKFDQLQDFQFYYPYFNHGNILKRLNQMYYQRIMKKKKQVKKQSVKLISQTGI